MEKRHHSKNTLLEHAIIELDESNDMKESHIEKSLKKNELFLREVTEREEQLNMTIKKQEEMIASASKKIFELKMVVNEMINKPTTTEFTQADN